MIRRVALFALASLSVCALADPAAASDARFVIRCKVKMPVSGVVTDFVHTLDSVAKTVTLGGGDVYTMAGAVHEDATGKDTFTIETWSDAKVAFSWAYQSKRFQRTQVTSTVLDLKAMTYRSVSVQTGGVLGEMVYEGTCKREAFRG